MTAQEARKLTESSGYESFESIINEIKNRAISGSTVTVCRITSETAKKLADLGYSITNLDDSKYTHRVEW